MDNLASGTNKQFRNLLDEVAADRVESPRSLGDDGLLTLTALGPSVGDDGGHGFVFSKEYDSAWTLTALGPSVGDDNIAPV